MGRQSMRVESPSADPYSKNYSATVIHQINPSESYAIPATFYDFGPPGPLVDAGRNRTN